jgi:hypothetical protein
MPNGDLGKGIRKLKNMPEPAEKPASTTVDDDFMAMDEELYPVVEKPIKKSTPPPTVAKSAGLEEGEEREDGEEMEEVVDTPSEIANADENEKPVESKEIQEEEPATEAEVKVTLKSSPFATDADKSPSKLISANEVTFAAVANDTIVSCWLTEYPNLPAPYKPPTASSVEPNLPLPEPP